MTPAEAPSRWARAWALGVASAGLAAAGHIAGGGHLEPASMALLAAGASVAGYGWLSRERGLVAIWTAVVAVQGAGHVLAGVGHTHAMDARMLMGHLVAAAVLAGFLRWGEARVFAAARRRYLEWSVAVRSALAGLPELPAWRPAPVAASPVAHGRTPSWTVRGRGPPRP